MFGGKKIIIIIYISIADMENYGVSKVLVIYIYIYIMGERDTTLKAEAQLHSNNILKIL